MRRFEYALLAAIALSLTPTPAAASIFGEENVTLGAILAENIKTNTQYAQTIVTLKQALQVARDTERAASDAVQIVQNVELIVRDPVGYLRANALQFAHSFPEVNDLLLANAQLVRRTTSLFNGSGKYDPYAIEHELDDIRNLNSDAYGVVRKAVDRWHIVDAHDQNLAIYKQMHEQTQTLVRETSTYLSPQKAAVYAAQSSALMAEASVQANAMLNDLVTIERQRFMAEIEANTMAKATSLDFMRPPGDPEAADHPIFPWTLDSSSQLIEVR